MTLSSLASACDLGRLLGQELVERRVEQPDGDREPLHGAEDGLEVGALHRQQLGQRALPAGRVLRDDHLAHGSQPLALEEHVLGAAEADAFGAEVPAAVRVGRRVGVDPHPELPHAVGPLHEPDEVAAELGGPQRGLAGEHLAGAAVHRDPVALARAAGRPRPRAPRARPPAAPGAPTTQGLPMPARHDRRVRGHAAARREHGLGHHHAVEVLGRGLPPHQDDRLARAAELLGAVGVEDHRAARRAGRRGQPGGQQVELAVRIDGRMQQLVQIVGRDARDGLLLAR